MKRVFPLAGAAAFAAGLLLAATSASADVTKTVEHGVNVWRPSPAQAAPATKPCCRQARHHRKSRVKVVVDAARLFQLAADREAWRRQAYPGYPFDTWFWSSPRYPF